MKQRVSEKDVQRAILDWLAWKRIFHYRNNSGAFKDTNNHLYGLVHSRRSLFGVSSIQIARGLEEFVGCG
jgi:hypothetical protein